MPNTATFILDLRWALRRSERIAAMEHEPEGRQREDLQIEEERPVLDIGDVVSDPTAYLLSPFRRTPAPVDLGEAGKSWLDPVALCVFSQNFTAQPTLR